MGQNERKDAYYVYVYIDPRNFEEFYYGKGMGSRKGSHLFEEAENEKSNRIREIQSEGLSPIIRVVATGLNESEAFLVEKTLLWKLGKNLLNRSTGSGGYAAKFRPDNTMHRELHGFDFDTGVFYFNVGDGSHRNWEDCKRFEFISAGRGVQWRDAITNFNEGDVFAAYLKGKGFVGIGRIVAGAQPIRDVSINGRPLLNLDLKCQGMGHDIESDELCEYAAKVEWIEAVDRQHAKWLPKAGLYTTTHVRASLANQPATLRFLNEQFGVDLEALMGRRTSADK